MKKRYIFFTLALSISTAVIPCSQQPKKSRRPSLETAIACLVYIKFDINLSPDQFNGVDCNPTLIKDKDEQAQKYYAQFKEQLKLQEIKTKNNNKTIYRAPENQAGIAIISNDIDGMIIFRRAALRRLEEQENKKKNCVIL